MPDEIKLHETDDAAIWASEFMRIFESRKSDIDEGLMIGWFANAMETAKDMQSRARIASLEADLAEAVGIIHDVMNDAYVSFHQQEEAIKNFHTRPNVRAIIERDAG